APTARGGEGRSTTNRDDLGASPEPLARAPGQFSDSRLLFRISSDYYPAVWRDMSSSTGKQYMLPLEKKSLLVVYYNTSLLSKAGVTPPRTWAAFAADAAKIKALGPNYHGVAWTPAVAPFFDMVVADGGKVFSTSGHRRAFALDNPGAVQALTMLRSMVASGAMITTTGYQYQLDFGTGNVGMLIDASAGYTYDKGSAGSKFKMGGVPAPAGSSGHSSQYINGASMVLFDTGTTADKQAAWTFMKWMSSPPTNSYWDEHANYLPLGPAAHTAMASYYSAHPAQAASYSPASQWWYKPRTPNYLPAENAILSVLTKALSGKIGVTAALKQMDSSGTPYLSGKLRP
ncbi:MAG: extracellular solute-binding protein, partial [Acidimicrobiales bacterium]